MHFIDPFSYFCSSLGLLLLIFRTYSSPGLGSIHSSHVCLSFILGTPSRQLKPIPQDLFHISWRSIQSIHLQDSFNLCSVCLYSPYGRLPPVYQTPSIHFLEFDSIHTSVRHLPLIPYMSSIYPLDSFSSFPGFLPFVSWTSSIYLLQWDSIPYSFPGRIPFNCLPLIPWILFISQTTSSIHCVDFFHSSPGTGFNSFISRTFPIIPWTPSCYIPISFHSSRELLRFISWSWIQSSHLQDFFHSFIGYLPVNLPLRPLPKTPSIVFEAGICKQIMIKLTL